MNKKGKYLVIKTSRTKIFMDTEFSELQQNGVLLSIGMVAEDGREFYAELHKERIAFVGINDWVRDNVVANFTQESTFICRYDLGKMIEEFLSPYDSVEVWGDCLAYDWVHFTNIWKHAFNVPKKVYYIPFDIATAMRIKGVNPDVCREEFAGLTGTKHNALHDARVIKACFGRLFRFGV